jgi:hypothetical protein
VKISELIEIGQGWGFETPNFTIRFALLQTSDEYHNPQKHPWIIYHATNILKMERFADNSEKAQRNEERWENLRQMFFGKEIPEYWNELRAGK